MARMLSTPLFDAASISDTSRMVPFNMPRQISHSLQGFPSTGCRQFTARANILASVVLPVPLVPENRYAWATRFCVTAFFSMVTTLSCSTTSSNVRGRHLR